MDEVRQHPHRGGTFFCGEAELDCFIKIGMLTVAQKYQSNGLATNRKRCGSMLLQEAVHDIQQRAKGGAVILVDAINKKVKNYYKNSA